MKSYTLHHPDIVKIGFPLVFPAIIFYGVIIGLDQGFIPGLLLIIFSTLFLFVEFLRILDNITYDQDGIEIKRAFRKPSSFNWNEIEGVNVSVRTINLTDIHGNKLIGLDKNMLGTEHFFNYLSQRVPHIFSLPTQQKLNRNSKYVATLMLVFIFTGVLFFWIFNSLNFTVGIFVGVAPVIFVTIVYIKSTREITFGIDRLLISSLTSKKEYPVNQIESINLEVKRIRNANHHYVHVIKTSGKSEKLSLIGHVPIILYYQLKSWFDKVKHQTPRV